MPSIPSKPCPKCGPSGECFQHKRMRENREAMKIAEQAWLQRMVFVQTHRGVYSIKNTVNGREYIGQTSINFYDRWKDHRRHLRRGDHVNKELQSDWTKYGESGFDFVILEVTDIPVVIERFHIRKRKVSGIPPYNFRER